METTGRMSKRTVNLLGNRSPAVSVIRFGPTNLGQRQELDVMRFGVRIFQTPSEKSGSSRFSALAQVFPLSAEFKRTRKVLEAQKR